MKIYIDLPGVGNCCQDFDDIQLEYSEKSLCLTIKNYVPPSSIEVAVDKDDDDDDGMELSNAPTNTDEDDAKDGNKLENRCLSFAKLYGEIVKATYRKKTDKVIVTLIKKEMKEWTSIIA